ncbi:MAG: major capsid protein [Eubacteriales bacterium]|nr:major capsid protein [Eubacteriales bacterium]
MANTIDIYTPRCLAEVVRTVPPVRTFFRDTFFTNRRTFVSERIDIDIVKGNRKMAAFISPVIGGKPSKRDGYRTASYKPPLVSDSILTTADSLLKRLPGEDPYSGKTPADRAAQKLVEEYSSLNDSVTRREEWMAAQAIIEGQIHVVGNGVDEVIDFGLTNKVNVTSTKQWGKAEADPLNDLNTWVRKIFKEGFANADMAIMGEKALDLFINDAKVQKLLDNRRMEIGGVDPRDLPNGARYIGHLTTPNIDIYEYAEVFTDDWTDPSNPTTKALVPENKVIVIPSASNFAMNYGAVTYLDENENWVTSETDRVLRKYIQRNPDRKTLEVLANPLPVPDKADSWLVATVC